MIVREEAPGRVVVGLLEPQTMVGLVGNILLGLQLTRLDRYADALVADCQRKGLNLRQDG